MKGLFLSLLMISLFAVSIPAYGQFRFGARLTGAQEVPVPGVDTETAGTVVAHFDRGFTRVHVVLRVRDGVGVTRAHFHCQRPGENGPITVGLFDPGPLFFDGAKAEGVLTNEDFEAADCVPEVGRPVNNIAALAFAMQDGLIYANVHTSDHPGGEIRGQLLEIERDDRPGRGRGRGRGGDAEDDEDEQD